MSIVDGPSSATGEYLFDVAPQRDASSRRAYVPTEDDHEAAAATASDAPTPPPHDRHGEHPSREEAEEEEKQHSHRSRSRHRSAKREEPESKSPSDGYSGTGGGGLKASDLPGSSSRGSSRSSSSRSTSRGSSPVILWRATNRVKEALDIPAELRSVFLREEGDDLEGEGEGEADGLQSHRSPLSHRKLTASYAPQALSTLDRIALTRSSNDFDAASAAMQELELNLNPRYQAERQKAKLQRVKRARLNMSRGGGGGGSDSASSSRISALLSSKPPPPTDSSFTYKGYRPRVPRKYGSWYLPTSLWLAEDRPGAFSSTLSHRADVSRAHMTLGAWGSIGVSKHGRDTRQQGQAEYEEARTKMGLNGLASWQEIQSGTARLGASSMLPGRVIQGQSRTTVAEDEDDDAESASEKIAQIKTLALEARARRRRELDRAKVEQYERRRAAVKAHLVAKAMQAKGVFSKHTAAMDQDAQEALLMSTHASGGPGGALQENDSTAQGKKTSVKGGARSFGYATSSSSTSSSAASASLEEKLALLREQIPHLQIAQAYKSYVQGLGARVPHFLHNTDAMATAGPAQTMMTAEGGYGKEGDGGPPPPRHHHASGMPISSAGFAAASAAAGSSGSDSDSPPHGQSRTARPPLSPQPPSYSHPKNLQGGLGQRVSFASGGAASGAATDRADYRFR